jgi:hypothetical protein
MAATPESKVKKKVVELLKAAGAYYFYPVTSGYGHSGVFDIVVCYGGRFIGIECKADMKKSGPTKLQSRNASIAKTSGCTVLLVDKTNVGLVTEVLNTIEDSGNDTSERLDRLNFWPFDGVTS